MNGSSKANTATQTEATQMHWKRSYVPRQVSCKRGVDVKEREEAVPQGIVMPVGNWAAERQRNIPQDVVARRLRTEFKD